MNYDSAIRVGTGIDLSGIKSDIKAYKKELNTLLKEEEKLSKQEAEIREKYAPKKAENESIIENTPWAKANKSARRKEIEAEEKEELSAVDAKRAEINQKAQEYNALLEAANEKLQQMNAISDASKELDGAIKSDAILDKISTREEYNSLLEETKAKMATIEERARKIAEAHGVSQDALLATNKDYQKLSDTMKALESTAPNAFKKAKKEANGLNDAVKKGIKKISKMALAVLGIRGAYSLVRRAVNACLQSNEELNNKMTAIWNALGTIMEPVVTAMMDAIYKILAYINYFVKAITGIDFVANANAKAIAKQASATDKLTKSTKEANKALASFDEMNVLQDKTATTTSAIDSVPTLDLPELSDEEIESLNTIIGIFEDIADGIEDVKRGCEDLVEWWGTLDESTQILLATLGIGGLVGILVGGANGLTVFGAFLAVGMMIDAFNKLVNGDTTDAIDGLLELLGASGLAGALFGGVKGMSVGIAIASVIGILNGLNKLFSGDTTEAIEGVIEILIGSGSLYLALEAIKAMISGKSGVTAVLEAMKNPLLLVAAGVAILLGGILELSKNWNKMTDAQKVSTILWGLVAAATAAGIAFAIFHTTWTAGVAAVTIAAGLAALGLTLGGLSSHYASVNESAMASANEFAKSDFTSNPLPKLAVGGIVNNPGRGVPAIIGEAGAEAILPLENNTEWMDVLAEKIGGNVTIPIYMDGKKIATYVVDIQKKKAFAMNGA